MSRILLVHPDDDMVVALQALRAGDSIDVAGQTIVLNADVPAKHKFSRRAFAAGQSLLMYNQIVGRATAALRPGDLLSRSNLQHAVAELKGFQGQPEWRTPDIRDFEGRTFDGFPRGDGTVGTRNYWIVVPMVFCQNRNVDVLRRSLTEQLGYSRPHPIQALAGKLIELHHRGASTEQIQDAAFERDSADTSQPRPFPNVDGVRFLTHDGGCGGLYQDAETLCGLLAGYINHPNVAGATVLSLGCQKSQVETLQSEIHRRNPGFGKPLYILEQQQEGTESQLMEKAVRFTISGIAQANQLQRQPAPLSHLNIGVECGGSDGFSGISANPAIGVCSDLIVALGGSVILSEFPELSGCENELVSRCRSQEIADRFLAIMRAYEARTRRDGGGFDQNPSPGNVADGLITDAMKSAGAARKGGSSPVVDVLDYPEPVTRPGLNLLCTPGGDVESTTAMAGAGATVQLFSTGLGTPTGNPVSPVLKISSNSELMRRMPDIIDLDAGAVISGSRTIEQVGAEILEQVIATASGRYECKAERLGQYDFIPWKRGISI